MLEEDPSSTIDDLAAQVPEVDPGSAERQLAELVAARAFTPQVSRSRLTVAIDSRAVRAWLRWAEADEDVPH